MLTIISFILTILGSINWLLIGLLQYDFVAGIFGYQGSVFSRLIYIVIGAACIMLIVKMIKGKGTIAVFSRRNKKDLAKNIQKMQTKSAANVEAAHDDLHEVHHEDKNSFDEIDDNSHFGRNDYELERDRQSKHEDTNGLFDEHFGD